MTDELPFSERYGFAPRPIVYRDDLSDALRQPLIDIIRKATSEDFLQERIRRVFNPYGIDSVPQRTGDISISGDERPEFAASKRVLLGCPWFRLYDLIEDLYQCLEFHDRELAYPDEDSQAYPFRQSIDRYLVHAGIGWQFAGSRIVARGNEAFESAVNGAYAALSASSRPTAAGRIHDALQALSRRPSADLAGAITHAMGALEATARDLVGDDKATLGEILKRHPTLLPSPLDRALSQVWGFASNEARHVVEGRAPSREDAEMIVGLAATVASYLSAKGGHSGRRHEVPAQHSTEEHH